MSTAKKTEQQAVVKAETTALTMAPQVSDENIDSNDVLIPKLLVMQPMSDYVHEDKASPGDLVKYPTAEVVAKTKKGDKSKLIPLTFMKTWVLSEKVGNKFEFRRVEPFTAANSDAPWEFKENGVDWRRDKSLDIFCLLPQDVEGEMTERKRAADDGDYMDPAKAALPVLVSFRRTSYKAGQAIITHFAKAAKFKVPAFVNMFEISAHQETNDHGTFFVLDVAEGGKTEKRFFDAAQEWIGVIGKGRVKVDNSDLEAESTGTPINVSEEKEF